MEGVSKEKALKTFKSNLEAALPLLEAAKVVGLIEPINPYSVPLSEILPFLLFCRGAFLIHQQGPSYSYICNGI